MYIEQSTGFEMGLGVQPIQPPHPPLEIGIITSGVSGFTGIFSFVSNSDGSMDVSVGILGAHSGTTIDATPAAGAGPQPSFRVSSLF